MKFIFRIGLSPALALLALGAAACSSSPRPAARRARRRGRPAAGRAARLRRRRLRPRGPGRPGGERVRVRGAAPLRVGRAQDGGRACWAPRPARTTACCRPSRAWTSWCGPRRTRATVTRACRAAREDAIARFGLRTTPTERPSLARAEKLYAEGCAPVPRCAGRRGHGAGARRSTRSRPASATPSGSAASPPTASTTRSRSACPGPRWRRSTSLSPADRWSLAFYVFRLGHEGEPARGRRSRCRWPTWPSAPDHELADALRALGHPDPARRRRACARARPRSRSRRPASASTRRAACCARPLAQRAGGRLPRGRPPCARRVPAGLRAAGAAAARARRRRPRSAVEEAFGAPARRPRARRRGRRADGTGEALDAQLARLGRRRRVAPAAGRVRHLLPRGGGGRAAGGRAAGGPACGWAARTRVRYIHCGWLAALPAGVAHLVAGRARGAAWAPTTASWSEGVVGLLAAAVLFSVSFWMISKVESRHWMGYLRRQLETTLIAPQPLAARRASRSWPSTARRPRPCSSRRRCCWSRPDVQARGVGGRAAGAGRRGRDRRARWDAR